MMMAVAGRTFGGSYAGADTTPSRVPLKLVEAPVNEGLDYMKKGSVTVGRAGRLSVHTLDERALGMMGTECPPSCMHRAYRSRRVVP